MSKINKSTHSLLSTSKAGRRAIPWLSTVMIATTSLTFWSSTVKADQVVLTDEIPQYRQTVIACRFLANASMGGTEAEINALADRILETDRYIAFEEWIDNQFAIPAGPDLSTAALEINQGDGLVKDKVIDGFVQSWWNSALRDQDQLRIRTAFALSQIFVVSQDYWAGEWRTNRYRVGSNYLQMLRENAFTSHRELLDKVTFTPLMGGYLTYAYNNKANEAAGVYPDQNYAREVMQLFSCGVYSQTPNGEIILDASGVPVENYTNEDITEMAQVFTGFSLTDDGRLPGWSIGLRAFHKASWYLLPMMVNNEYHDQSSKIMPDGTVIPAGNTGVEDVRLTLDWLSAHPSTAPYFSRLLIQRFTSSNPSSEYIGRVVDNWNGTGEYSESGVVGDMKAVLKAILLDPEVIEAVDYAKKRNSRVDRLIVTQSNDPYHGKLKEPILKMSQLLRFCELSTTREDGHLRLSNLARGQGQEILFAKSVFNFYASDYAPGSGPIGLVRESTDLDIVAPEFEIMSQNAIPEFEDIYNMALSKDTGKWVDQDGPVMNKLIEIYAAYPEPLDFVEYIDRMLCAGQIPYSILTKMANQIASSNEPTETKLAQALALILASPDYSIAR